MNEHYNLLIQTHKRQYCAVMSAVRDVFEIDPLLLQRKTRLAHIVWPRQLCMTIFHEAFGWTQVSAAGVFRGMDHGTAIHARASVYSRIETCAKDKVQAKLLIDKTLRYMTKLKKTKVFTGSLTAKPT